MKTKKYTAWAVLCNDDRGIVPEIFNSRQQARDAIDTIKEFAESVKPKNNFDDRLRLNNCTVKKCEVTIKIL